MDLQSIFVYLISKEDGKQWRKDMPLLCKKSDLQKIIWKQSSNQGSKKSFVVVQD